MTDRERYDPGPAQGATIHQEGDRWVLVLTRELRHPPEKVWRALTDPAELREWAPFDTSAPLGTVGNEATLTTVAAPGHPPSVTTVRRADAPKLLVYDWGGREMRWELEPSRDGTHLMLWTSIDRPYIAMGAAGWHICFDVMDRRLAGTPIGRIVAADALRLDGWQRLHTEYKQLFDQEAR
jgi:uncharacterized protein YndB with AHSA1/START domain